MIAKKISIENIYLFLIIPIGIMYMTFIPIGLVPDESAHFGRAYEVASFHLTSSLNEENYGGRILPVEVYENIAVSQDYSYSDLLQDLNKRNSGKKAFLLFPNTALYNAVCYIPQAIGIMIGKTLNLPTTIIAYLGRITNFITFIILMYFSIKFIPFLKNFLVFVSFIPIVMQEAISLSPDALTIGVASFLFSYVMYLTYNKKDKLNKKNYMLLSGLVVVMSLCKIVYLPLCLLLFLIPKERFTSNKDKYLKIGLLALIVILINLVWLKYATRYLIEFQEGVNSLEQVKNILNNPLNYIQVFFNSWAENVSFYLFTMLGKGLEWFNIDLNYIYPLMTFIILISFMNSEKYPVNQYHKIIVFIIIISTILLMFTSLYVQWTPVGNPVINGVQGRYFIPILFLLPFLFLKDSKKIYTKPKYNGNIYLYSFLTFQSFYTLIVIFLNHI